MAILEIPLRNDLPKYTQQVDLEGKLYFLTFRFGERSQRWSMDIADENEQPLIYGVPLLVKQRLLSQYVSDALPPGKFIFLNEADENTQCDRASFGGDCKLFYQESNG